MAVSGNLQIWELTSGTVNSGDLLVACPFGSMAYNSPVESFVSVGLTSGIITSGKIGNGAVVSGSIASGSIGNFHIASGAVTSGEIGNAAVVSGSIASGQVGANHFASGVLGSVAVLGTTSGEYFVPLARTISGLQQEFAASGLMFYPASGSLKINQENVLNNLNGALQNQNFGYQNAPYLRSGGFWTSVQTFGFQNFLAANAINQSTAFGSLLFTALASGTNVIGMGYNNGFQAVALRDTTIVGTNSMQQVVSGNNIIVIGSRAGTAASGGGNVTSLTNAVILGHDITHTSAIENNIIVIGQSGKSQGSNTTVIGNAQTTSGTIYGFMNFPQGINPNASNVNDSVNYRLLFQKADGSLAYNSGFMYNPADGTLFLGSGGIIISDVPSNNTIIAARSITNPTVPSGQVCVIVGDSILENNNKATGVVALGYSIGNSDGDQAGQSVALGWQTYTNYLGTNNVGIGYKAASVVASGTSNTVAVGAFALGFAANASINTTAIGYGAAQNLRAGAQNSTYIGVNSNTGVASGLFPLYEMAFNGTGSGNYKINMGDTNHTRFWTNGVVESVNGLEVVPSGKPAVFSVNASGDVFATSFASGSAAPQKLYLNAFSTETQYNSGTQNTSKRMNWNNVSDSYGISLRSGNEILFTKSGMYNIQFSAQFEKTDAGSSDFDVWFSLNSGNISNSNTQWTITGNNAKMVATLNFMESIPVTSGQYMSINWNSANEHTRILYLPTQTTPDRPAIPSVILTVWEI